MDEACLIFREGFPSHLRKERHSVSDLKVHLVCVTKYRRSVFTRESLVLIEESFKEVARKMDLQILEFNGEADHIHVLMEYPPKLSISQIVNSLKGVSSRLYGKAGFKKPSNFAERVKTHYCHICSRPYLSNVRVTMMNASTRTSDGSFIEVRTSHCDRRNFA